jgi:hypothetical protein
MPGRGKGVALPLFRGRPDLYMLGASTGARIGCRRNGKERA